MTVRALALLPALLLTACAADAPSPSDGVPPEPALPVAAPQGGLMDFLRCATENAVLISAHRGGVEPGYPENAIETFANTVAHAPMLLEMDVRRSADGVLLLMHDDTLDRTTTGRGRVDAADWAEIAALNLIDDEGSVTGFHPPSLEDVLEWARGRAIIQLDVKRDVDIAEVVEAVIAHDAQGYAKIITYNDEDALTVSRNGPDIVYSLSVSGEDDIETLRAAGGDITRLVGWTGLGRELDPELRATLEADDIPVSFGALWRLDDDVRETGDASVYQALLEQGVDILATDLHREAYDALEAVQDTGATVRLCLDPAESAQGETASN